MDCLLNSHFICRFKYIPSPVSLIFSYIQAFKERKEEDWNPSHQHCSKLANNVHLAMKTKEHSFASISKAFDKIWYAILLLKFLQTLSNNFQLLRF